MDESAPNPLTPVNPPIAQPADVPQPLPMPASPSFGGYQLLQPLLANTDGELWLVQHKVNGALAGLALLSQDALADPGAIWRFKQEMAKSGPEQGARLALLTLNPPQGADDATNLRRLHTVRPGVALPVAARKVRTEAEKKKERKVMWIILGVIGFGLLAVAAFYAALFYYVIMPSIKWQAEHQKAERAKSTADELTLAVEQWAADNSVADGTKYTWHEVSDHVPNYLRTNGSSPPRDPLGNEYYFPPTGRDVEIDPATKTVLDSTEPMLWSTP